MEDHSAAVGDAGAQRTVLYHSPGDAWRVGVLLPSADSGSSGLVQVQDTENRQLYTVRLASELLDLGEPLPPPAECADLLALGGSCDEARLLCVLRSRYQQGMPCSAMGGSWTVSVNPGRPLPPPEAGAEEYLRVESPATQPPHAWGAAGRALRHVEQGMGDAAVVIAGDAGSGKSGAAREALAALLQRAVAPPAEGAPAEGASPVVRLRAVAAHAEFDAGRFAADVGEHLGVDPSAVQLLSAEPVTGPLPPQTDLRFRFVGCGETGERLAHDFAGFAELLPGALLDALQPVAARLEPPPARASPALLDIAEAFCCCTTGSSSSSSRAAVATRLAVSPSGAVVGAELRHFLLDTARACRAPPGERVFHVFYYMVAGASDAERGLYYLDGLEHALDALAPPGDWGQQQAGAAAAPPWEQEAQELAGGWGRLQTALDMCRVPQRVQDWAWRVLAAVLHLSLFRFAEQAQGTVIAPECKHALGRAAVLLDVNFETLSGCFARPSAADSEGDPSAGLTPVQAGEARDALCRALYQRVVDVVFASVNAALSPPPDSSVGWLTVLDCVAPEDSPQNGLRALMVNFANEVVQQFANRCVFQREVDDWARELGGEVTPQIVDFDDNTALVKLLRARGGIFDLIDEEAAAAAPSDKRLLDTLHERLRKHARFERRAPPEHAFVLRHSGGPVDYHVAGMTTTNRNFELPEHLRLCMVSSQCKYTREVFMTLEERESFAAAALEQAAGGAGRRSDTPSDFSGVRRLLLAPREPPQRMTCSASGRFQVAQMLALLEPPDGAAVLPLFVRCLRPARVLSRGEHTAVFHGRHVLRQLRACGLAAVLRQLAVHPYPVRMAYSDFCRAVRLLLQERESTEGQAEAVQDRARDLLLWCGLPEDAFRCAPQRLLLTLPAWTAVTNCQHERLAERARIVQAWALGRVADEIARRAADARAEELRRQLRARQLVRDRAQWEQAREAREAAGRRRLLEEESRGRRNCDNLEAIDYIAIMTGLIDGAEQVKRRHAAERRRQERERQQQLEAMVIEERQLEDSRRRERLTHRVLQQGGKLDRIFARRQEVEQRAEERRYRSATQQERALERRVALERKRLRDERKLLGRQREHDAFAARKRQEHEHRDRERVERIERDRIAREARMQARRVWEEAKQEEFEMDAIEREVMHRVDQELASARRARSCNEAATQKQQQQEQQHLLLRMERVRAQRVLALERQAAKEKAAEEEERRAREREAWQAQNQQRMLREEAERIHQQAERRRFAKRQEEKLKLSTPMVWQQLVSSQMGSQAGSVAGTPRPTLGSPRRFASAGTRSPGGSPRSAGTPRTGGGSVGRFAAKDLPLYQRIPPPAPFVMSNGRQVLAQTISPGTMRGLRAYHEDGQLPRSPSDARLSSSRSPGRSPLPRVPQHAQHP